MKSRTQSSRESLSTLKRANESFMANEIDFVNLREERLFFLFALVKYDSKTNH